MIENEKITTSINPKKGQRILGQDNMCVGQERFTINSDEITKNLKNPRTKQFAKFVLSCSLRSHNKTNPRQKWLRHIWLCPPTTQNKRIP